jgi:hypothetical protein
MLNKGREFINLMLEIQNRQPNVSPNDPEDFITFNKPMVLRERFIKKDFKSIHSVQQEHSNPRNSVSAGFNLPTMQTGEDKTVTV